MWGSLVQIQVRALSCILVALVAQSVERQAFNLVVRGSSPREGVRVCVCVYVCMRVWLCVCVCLCVCLSERARVVVIALIAQLDRAPDF